MPMPGAPPAPPGMPPPGAQAPAPPGMATPMAPKRGGQEARGEALVALCLKGLRIAIPFLAESEKGQAVTEAVAKLGRKFSKNEGDIEQSELKFLMSQLQAGQPQGGGGPQGAGVPAGGPPPPPPPPGMGEAAA